MTAPIERSLLTRQVVTFMVDALASDQILVGRGTAPQAGGWPQGQPGKGDFKEYLTIKTGVATQNPTGPDTLGHRKNRQGWAVGYLFTYSAVKDSRADDIADLGRKAIVQLDGNLDLAGEIWTVNRIDIPRLGPSTPNRSTSPPFWEVTDGVSVWLTRA